MYFLLTSKILVFEFADSFIAMLVVVTNIIQAWVAQLPLVLLSRSSSKNLKEISLEIRNLSCKMAKLVARHLAPLVIAILETYEHEVVGASHVSAKSKGQYAARIRLHDMLLRWPHFFLVVYSAKLIDDRIHETRDIHFAPQKVDVNKFGDRI